MCDFSFAKKKWKWLQVLSTCGIPSYSFETIIGKVKKMIVKTKSMHPCGNGNQETMHMMLCEKF